MRLKFTADCLRFVYGTPRCFGVGEVVELSEAESKAALASGVAVPVAEPARTATAAPAARNASGQGS